MSSSNDPTVTAHILLCVLYVSMDVKQYIHKRAAQSQKFLKTDMAIVDKFIIKYLLSKSQKQRKCCRWWWSVRSLRTLWHVDEEFFSWPPPTIFKMSSLCPMVMSRLTYWLHFHHDFQWYFSVPCICKLSENEHKYEPNECRVGTESSIHFKWVLYYEVICLLSNSSFKTYFSLYCLHMEDIPKTVFNHKPRNISIIPAQEVWVHNLMGTWKQQGSYLRGGESVGAHSKIWPRRP